jgi:hypothetical protein
VLKPLPRDEALRYVEYRLAAYDGSADRVFSPGALEYLLQHAFGVPRQINVLCHNAMLTAYSARSTRVTLDIARSCVSELEGPVSKTEAPDSSRRQESAIRRNSGQAKTAPGRPLVSQKIAAATSGMGIGLLIVSIVVMSVLWLFDMRYQERPRNGSADAEVPAIFNDDWNASSETGSGEGNQIAETTGTRLNAAGSTAGFDTENSKVPEGNKILSQEHGQVTVSRGGPDNRSSAVHGSGFGS